MGRPAKKKAYVEAKAREKARLQAQVEMQRKKPLDVSAKEHIGKIIDNLSLDDLSTLVASIGLTFVVHDTIIASQTLFNRVMRLVTAPKTLLEQASKALKGEPIGVLGVINVYLSAIHDWLPFLGQFVPSGIGKTEGATIATVTATEQGGNPYVSEVIVWLISFSIAYILIKHGGQIFGLLNTGLGGILGLMLGA